MTKNFIKKIERFFASNTVWVFLTLLLFVSLIRVKETHPPTFMGYYLKFMLHCFLFFPVLLYSGFRQQIKRHFNKKIVKFLWIFAFILYPFCISFLPIEQWLDFKWNGLFVLFVGTALLLSELAIQGNDYIRKNISAGDWFKKISLEKTLLAFIFLISMLLVLANNTFQEKYHPLPWYELAFYFISFSLQFFIVLSSYYLFYYINHYLLVPRFLKQKGLVYYGFSFAATLLILYPIVGQLVMIMPAIEALDLGFATNANVFYEDNHIIFPLVIMFLSIPSILVLEWFKSNHKIATLEKEKSDTELNFLKQQINPHFFFNTLNNLYALSLTKDKQTPEVILQLSELMRYVIYKGKEKQVLLKEEIKYIEDYIQLQQIRLHKNLDFKFEKNIADENVYIPPLLFITFVENAFKHGIEPAEKACFLHLFLKSEEGKLRFVCKNSFEEKIKQTSGIGLDNLRRRMTLRFPEQHQIRTQEDEEVFEAKLDLKIEHHL